MTGICEVCGREVAYEILEDGVCEICIEEMEEVE